MKREVFESQKAFAGEKKPSMQRRCVGHDYTERMMYMVTMVTEGRRPLFGCIVGRSDAMEGSEDAPHIELTELGRRVSDEWWGIPRYYPQIEIVSLQMMPDHLHGILFVRERMEKDLSRVIRGFKTGCNRAYRELVLGAGYVATKSPQTKKESPQTKKDRNHGFLFALGFNDKLLLHPGQLQRWLNYLHDNPRRLLMKREHPDLFRVQRGLMAGGQQFSAIGNRFLLQRPVRLQVQCSRRLTDDEIAENRLGGSRRLAAVPYWYRLASRRARSLYMHYFYADLRISLTLSSACFSNVFNSSRSSLEISTEHSFNSQ